MPANREGFDDLENVAVDFLESIELCCGNGLIQPGLILIYSCLDTLASFDRSFGEKHDRSTFKRWVEKYLLPIGDSDVTSIDIYAARCGLVHTYSPESDLSERGDAMKISYAWGDANDDSLRRLIADLGWDSSIRTLHVDKLIKALRLAIEKFRIDYKNDPAREAAVTNNVRTYRAMSSGFADEISGLLNELRL